MNPKNILKFGHQFLREWTKRGFTFKPKLLSLVLYRHFTDRTCVSNLLDHFGHLLSNQFLWCYFSSLYKECISKVNKRLTSFFQSYNWQSPRIALTRARPQQKWGQGRRTGKRTCQQSASFSRTPWSAKSPPSTTPYGPHGRQQLFRGAGPNGPT